MFLRHSANADSDMDYVFRKDDELNRLPQCEMFYNANRDCMYFDCRNHMKEDGLKRAGLDCKLEIVNFNDMMMRCDMKPIKTAKYRYNTLPQHQLTMIVCVYRGIKDMTTMEFEDDISYLITKNVTRQTQDAICSDKKYVRFVESCKIIVTRNNEQTDERTQYTSFYSAVQRVFSEVNALYGARKDGYMKRFTFNPMCLGYQISPISAPGVTIEVPIYVHSVENFLMDGIKNEIFLGLEEDERVCDREKRLNSPWVTVTITNEAISPGMRITDTLQLKTIELRNEYTIESYTEVINANEGVKKDSTIHAVHISKILDVVTNVVLHYTGLIPREKRLITIRMDGYAPTTTKTDTEPEPKPELLFHWSNGGENRFDTGNTIVSKMNNQMKIYFKSKKTEKEMKCFD